MRTRRVVIIGAGMAGLSAALELSVCGHEVIVLERQHHPGGKMRDVEIAGQRIDVGPTVFTMRWVFDELFARAGTTLEHHLKISRAETLARHAWSGNQRLDLFADVQRSADAIAAFSSPAEARGYLEFCARAARVFKTLDHPFIRAEQPSPVELVRRIGLSRIDDLWQISPFTTLWRALGQHFSAPRLRQLFGRYATYCGSSPFHASATLMLIAHVEQQGVWLVDGGMHSVAKALASVATANGCAFRYGAHVAEITTSDGGASGVRLSSGEVIQADAVIANADVSALGAGHFGSGVTRAAAPVQPALRSLSAVTYALIAQTSGVPLLRHNVFFSDDYTAEFDAIFKRGTVPSAPTVYICAQDRSDTDGSPMTGPERLFMIVNAPANGDNHTYDPAELEQCEQRTFQHLERLGLEIKRQPEQMVRMNPADFEQRFPASGGALYGRASHGWTASFSRPGSATRIRRLYLAGGSVHPGPGVPMAALSGRIAARRVQADLASMSRSHQVAMPGGISTR